MAHSVAKFVLNDSQPGQSCRITATRTQGPNLMNATCARKDTLNQVIFTVIASPILIPPTSVIAAQKNSTTQTTFANIGKYIFRRPTYAIFAGKNLLKQRHFAVIDRAIMNPPTSVNFATRCSANFLILNDTVMMTRTRKRARCASRSWITRTNLKQSFKTLWF